MGKAMKMKMKKKTKIEPMAARAAYDALPARAALRAATHRRCLIAPAGGVGGENAFDLVAHAPKDGELFLIGPDGVCRIVEPPVVAVHLAGKRRAGLIGIPTDRDNRLDGLAEGDRPQRIGLSATQRPLDEIARFLSGTNRETRIVDCGLVKKMTTVVESPVDD